MQLSLSIRHEVGGGRCMMDKALLTWQNWEQTISSNLFFLCVIKKWRNVIKEGGNSRIPTRSLNVKVSAEVGTGRYCIWRGSYQEIIYCMVLSSKFTHQGLSSERFKLLNVTPVQIKPTLFANDRSFLVVASFSLILHTGDFFIRLPRRRRRRRRRSTSKTSVTHACCIVQGNEYDV